jgi:hypothetical protein
VVVFVTVGEVVVSVTVVSTELSRDKLKSGGLHRTESGLSPPDSSGLHWTESTGLQWTESGLSPLDSSGLRQTPVDSTGLNL